MIIAKCELCRKNHFDARDAERTLIPFLHSCLTRHTNSTFPERVNDDSRREKKPPTEISHAMTMCHYCSKRLNSNKVKIHPILPFYSARNRIPNTIRIFRLTQTSFLQIQRSTWLVSDFTEHDAFCVLISDFIFHPLHDIRTAYRAWLLLIMIMIVSLSHSSESCIQMYVWLLVHIFRSIHGYICYGLFLLDLSTFLSISYPFYCSIQHLRKHFPKIIYNVCIS